jgi:DNA-binding Xre family transcriptional regulator
MTAKKQQPRCPDCRVFCRKADSPAAGTQVWECPKCSSTWSHLHGHLVRQIQGPPIQWKLEAILEEVGLTRRELAEKAGLSYRETCRLVRGEVFMVRVDTIRRLALALHCPPGEWWEIPNQEGAADARA